MNNFNPVQPYYQPYFLQSQGNVYMIETPQDVANVPVGAGISAAINLKEGLIYLKTLQNGAPMLLGYKLSPLDISKQAQSTEQAEPTMEQRIMNMLDNFEGRLNALETNQKPKGGVDKWQI